MRGTRPAVRKLAIAAAALGAAGALILFIAGAVGGASKYDEHGRVAVPGKGTLEMPAGKVAVFYEERITLGENESLDAPENLRVSARREVTVRAKRKKIGNAINLDGRSMDEFATLELPQAGRYRVRVRGSGSNTPAVTFGEGLGEGFLDAGKNAGIALGAGLALAALLLLAGRIGYQPEPAVRYVEQPATAPPPPAPAAPATADGGDPGEELARLEELRRSGAVTPEEYEVLRERLLDSV